MAFDGFFDPDNPTYVGADVVGNWVRVKYSMSWPSSSDPFYLANPSDQTARRTYYGVNGIPAGFGNGSNAGGGANSWRSSALANIGQETPVSISLNGGMNGYELQLEVSVSAESDLSGTGTRLFVMTTIDSALYNATNGVYDHRSMFIDFLTPNTGTIITLDGINDYTASYTWTLQSNWPNGNTGVIWDLSMLNVVAFVQNYSTKEVYQAESARANEMNPDIDDDGILNGEDNCVDIYNPDQADVDSDQIGNMCDPCNNLVYIIGNTNGDLNQNGDPVIDIFDLFTLIDFTHHETLNECSENVMNINGDNHINILDVIELMQNLLNSD